ncbi:MAG: hypothetical protein RSE00_01740 [Clostridia bacterium]
MIDKMLNNIEFFNDEEDLKIKEDLKKVIKVGYSEMLEFFNIEKYNFKLNGIVIYKSIEEFQKEMFGKKRDDFGISCIKNKKLQIVNPKNPGKINNYDSVQKGAIYNLVLVIVDNMSSKSYIPDWLRVGVGVYVSKLQNANKTKMDISIDRFSSGYLNFSASYFVVNYIIRMYGKKKLLELLQNVDGFKEILGVSTKDFDIEINKYYKGTK